MFCPKWKHLMFTKMSRLFFGRRYAILNEDMRAVVVLYYYEGFSVKEISAVLKISEANAKNASLPREKTAKSYAGGIDMSFDDKIKTIIYAEDGKTPEEFSFGWRRTLSDLLKKPNSIKRWQRVCLSLAAVLIILVALPNLNSTMAHAMGDIPFIGEFFSGGYLSDLRGRQRKQPCLY